jgi:hypothetical protein
VHHESIPVGDIERTALGLHNQRAANESQIRGNGGERTSAIDAYEAFLRRSDWVWWTRVEDALKLTVMGTRNSSLRVRQHFSALCAQGAMVSSSGMRKQQAAAKKHTVGIAHKRLLPNLIAGLVLKIAMEKLRQPERESMGA